MCVSVVFKCVCAIVRECVCVIVCLCVTVFVRECLCQACTRTLYTSFRLQIACVRVRMGHADVYVCVPCARGPG